MQISFYQLTHVNLEKFLPKLLEKIVQQNDRAVVVLPNDHDLEKFDSILWTYHPESFLPHGSNHSFLNWWLSKTAKSRDDQVSQYVSVPQPSFPNPHLEVEQVCEKEKLVKELLVEKSTLEGAERATESAKDYPIWLTTIQENPNDAHIVVLTEPLSPKNDLFQKVVYVFDGAQDNLKSEMHNLARNYKSSVDHVVNFWLQDAQGKWVDGADRV